MAVRIYFEEGATKANSTSQLLPLAIGFLAEGESSTRIVVVGLSWETGTAPTTATIGGVSASKAVDQAHAGGQQIQVWYATVPGIGTTATFAGNNDCAACNMVTYTVYGANTPHSDSDSAQNSSATIAISALTIPTNGAGLFFWINDTASAVTWTNATESSDFAGSESNQAGSAHSTTAGTPTVTADGATDDQVLVGVAFSIYVAPQTITWPLDATGYGINLAVPGGVSTIILDIDNYNERVPYGLFEVSESGTYIYTPVSEGTDYLPDTTGGYEYAASQLDLGAGFSPEADVSGAFASEFEVVAVNTVVVVGDTAEVFASDYEVKAGYVPATDSVGDFASDFEVTTANAVVLAGDSAEEFASDYSVEAGYYPSVDVSGDFASQFDLSAGLVAPADVAESLDVSEGTYSADIQGGTAYEELGDVVGSFTSDYDSLVGYGYSEEGDSVADFATESETLLATAYSETGDAASEFASDFDLTVSRQYAYVGDIAGQFAVAEGTSTWSSFTQVEGTAAWRLSGGVSTVRLDIVDETRVPVAAAAAQHEFRSNLKIDEIVTGSVVGAFASGAESYSVVVTDYVETGAVAGDFVSDRDFYVGFEYVGDLVGVFASDASVSVIIGADHLPDTVADFVLSAQAGVVSAATVAIKPEVGVSAVFGFTVEYLLGLIRPEPEVALHKFVVGDQTYTDNLKLDIQYTGAVASRFAVGEDTLASYSISFPAIEYVADVSAYLSVAREYDINPEVGVVGIFTEAADRRFTGILPAGVGLGLGAEAGVRCSIDNEFFSEGTVLTASVPSGDVQADYLYDVSNAVEAFEAESPIVTTATFNANIVGDTAGLFAFSADFDAGLIQPEPSLVIVFGVDGVHTFTSAPGYTTTWACEDKPGRGAAIDGAWTEVGQDGAWTENVGWAMGEGAQDGAYTQDDAYLAEFKPNVFDAIEGVPSGQWTYESVPSVGVSIDGAWTEVGQDGASTEPGFDGAYTGLFQYAEENKPIATFTDEKKQTTG